jgi:hypothetical protein
VVAFRSNARTDRRRYRPRGNRRPAQGRVLDHGREASGQPLRGLAAWAARCDHTVSRHSTRRAGYRQAEPPRAAAFDPTLELRRRRPTGGTLSRWRSVDARRQPLCHHSNQGESDCYPPPNTQHGTLNRHGRSVDATKRLLDISPGHGLRTFGIAGSDRLRSCSRPLKNEAHSDWWVLVTGGERLLPSRPRTRE